MPSGVKKASKYRMKAWATVLRAEVPIREKGAEKDRSRGVTLAMLMSYRNMNFGNPDAGTPKASTYLDNSGFCEHRVARHDIDDGLVIDAVCHRRHIKA